MIQLNIFFRLHLRREDFFMEITQDQIIDNMRRCRRFEYCSAPVCPLNAEAEYTERLPEEEQCIFCVKRRVRGERRSRRPLTPYMLEVIGESEAKHLSERNLKAWRRSQKNNGNN